MNNTIKVLGFVLLSLSMGLVLSTLNFIPMSDDWIWLTRKWKDLNELKNLVLNFPFGEMYFRPLTVLTFALHSNFDEEISIVTARAVHIISWFVFLGVVLHVFYNFLLIIFSSFLNKEKAFFYSCLGVFFIVFNPSSAEVVAWISTRFDLFSALFSMFFISSVIEYQKRKNSLILILSFVFALFALSSKDQSIVFICWLFVGLYFLYDWQSLKKAFIVLLMAIFVFFVMRYSLNNSAFIRAEIFSKEMEFDVVFRLLLFVRTFCDQLFDLFFPGFNVGLFRHLVLPIEIQKALGKFLVSCIFVFLLAFLWKKNGYFKYFLYLISGIILMLLPTSNLLPTVTTGLGWYYADRFLFLSIIFYSLLLSMSCILFMKTIEDKAKGLKILKTKIWHKLNVGFIVIGLGTVFYFSYSNVLHWKSVDHWKEHQRQAKIEAPALVQMKIKELSNSKNYDEALILAKSILPKTEGQFPYLKVIMLEQILDIYIKKRDYLSALEYFNLVWGQHVFYESGRSTVVKNKNKLRMSTIGASLNFQLNNIDEALNYIEIANQTIKDMNSWEINENANVIKQLRLIESIGKSIQK